MTPVTRQDASRRRCLFTSAGDRNIVASWIDPRRPRSFDLIVAYYGDDDAIFADLGQIADRCVRIKGGKYPNAWNLWRRGELDLSRYDHVWLADDDMRIDPSDIDRSFLLAERHGFWVASPSHDPAGKISNPFMVREDGAHDIRIVSYIEVTWPLFRADRLEAFFEVFDGSLTCWGVDHWFARVLDSERNFRFAIFDCISAINTPDADKGGQREIGRLISDQSLADAYRIAREKHGFSGVRARTLARMSLEWDVRLAAFGDRPGPAPAITLVAPAADPAPADGGGEQPARRFPSPLPEEIDLVRRAMSTARNLSLFGASWILPLAAEVQPRRIVVVEADRGACEALVQDASLQDRLSPSCLTMLHADVGPLSSTGLPTGQAGMARWRAYPEAPWATWRLVGEAPDLLIAAGQFRKACCLLAYMHWHSLGVSGGRIVLRNATGPSFDFADELSGYFEVVERAGSYALLAPRPIRPGDDGSHAGFLLQRWLRDVR
ncbi:hypothetical protein GWK16_05035 [Roseomonas sp. JC162]|uniref:Uncharacterized protein n=1 Tax=Neoroseomonas marina TaxID=1232220 RepID=A0A848E8U9_9PROT|nr:hypothetical protein [Neoroseomonas marina]NMJ40592.1 hypothetical protein [Neoroseomonas marina]